MKKLVSKFYSVSKIKPKSIHYFRYSYAFSIKTEVTSSSLLMKTNFDRENDPKIYISYMNDISKFENEFLLSAYMKNLKKFLEHIKSDEEKERISKMFSLIYKKISNLEMNLTSICVLFSYIQHLHALISPRKLQKLEKKMIERIEANIYELNEISISSLSTGIRLNVSRSLKNSKEEKEKIERYKNLYNEVMDLLIDNNKNLKLSSFPIILYNFSSIKLIDERHLDLINAVLNRDSRLKLLRPEFYCQLLYAYCTAAKYLRKENPLDHIILQFLPHQLRFMKTKTITLMLKAITDFNEIPLDIHSAVENHYLMMKRKNIDMEFDELRICFIRFFAIHEFKIEITREKIKQEILNLIENSNIKFNTLVSASYSMITMKFLDKENALKIAFKIVDQLRIVQKNISKEMATNIYLSYYILHTCSFMNEVDPEIFKILEIIIEEKFDEFLFSEIVPLLIYLRNSSSISNLYHKFYQKFENGSYNNEIFEKTLKEMILTLMKNDRKNFIEKKMAEKIEKLISTTYKKFNREEIINLLNS